MFSCVTSVNAEEPTNSNNIEQISSIVPTNAIVYAQSNLKPLAQSIQKYSADFGLSFKNVNELALGDPYVIYSAAEKGSQDKIYYFPVIENDKIKMILSVIDDNGNYTSELQEGIANELNNINYQEDNNHIFYSDDKKIYVQSDDDCDVLASVDGNFDSNNANNKNAENFENKSYEQKIEEITNNYAKETPTTSNSSSNEIFGANGFSTKAWNITQLNVNKCTVPQGNYNLCWAASVATTAKYRNLKKYPMLTAKQVANKMKISYNRGGTLTDMRNALSKYSVNNYSTSNKQLSFGKLQYNILSQYPVIMGCSSAVGGHAVTAIGYSTFGGVNLVTFYNSGTNRCSSVVYNSKGTKFSYAGYTFVWKTNVSRYK